MWERQGRESCKAVAPGRAVVIVCSAFAVVACASITASERPAFPRFKAPDSNRILLTASGGGYLTQRGRCLGLASISGENFRTLIWPHTADLSIQGGALVVTDSASGAAVRLGDYLKIGGGALPNGAAARLAPELTEPVPPECAANVGTVNPGFRKMTPPPT